jgi:signal peptidase I
MVTRSYHGAHRPRTTTPGRASLTARAGSRLVLTIVAGLLVAGLAPYTIGWQPSVITSGSMMPAIAPGDVVVAAPVSPTDIKPHDVVIFTDPTTPQQTVAHRVVSANPDGSFTTRGDANRSADSTPVAETAIQGRVLLRVPYIGLPKYWLAAEQWPPLITLCVILAALTLLGRRPPSAMPAADGVGLHDTRR